MVDNYDGLPFTVPEAQALYSKVVDGVVKRITTNQENLRGRMHVYSGDLAHIPSNEPGYDHERELLEHRLSSLEFSLDSTQVTLSQLNPHFRDDEEM